MIADMVEVTAIPAPTGMEAARAEWLTAKLRACGCDVAPPDEVGNVRARIGSGPLPPIMFAAHLDTVFPLDTDLTVRHEGGRIYTPGISDNGRGIAALVQFAAELCAVRGGTMRPIELVGTVGEEGAGDLRGVKHLFGVGVEGFDSSSVCTAFIAVDGAGLHRIVHRAVGSRRLRVTVRGPGGHSWADRGVANPIHALAEGIAAASSAPRHPESSMSVGVINGGTGVNVIPAAAHAEVDIRSEDRDEVARVESAVRSAVAASVQRSNDARKAGSDALTLTIETIGDRPAGATPADAQLVQLAMQATREEGGVPELGSSSTDANVPMSLGIPAIAIGAGGDAGGMHTTEEWYSDEGGAAGIRRLVRLALSLADARKVPPSVPFWPYIGLP